MRNTLKPMCYLFLSLLATACATDNGSKEHSHSDKIEHPVLSGILYQSDSIKVAKELVACTLSNGTKTECLSITVQASEDVGHSIGPWCPRNISDSAEKSGIWLNGGKVYDADGSFIQNLAEFYQDDEWTLFNPETGQVKVTDSKKACLAAARPDVAAEYQNYCVECLPSYFDSNPEITYLIPAKPVIMDKPERINPRSGVGLALNGVKLEAPAPLHAILAAHTLAPFDDCGGHVNPHVGYHYHAVTECANKISAEQEHAYLVGYAMDGFMLFSHKNTDDSIPTDLDLCSGHQTTDIGYHYHANEPGKNQILSCFIAEPGCSTDKESTSCHNTRGQRPPPPMMRK